MYTVLEFSIIFPAPPVVFGFLLAVLAVMLIYNAAKFVISLYTGA